MAHLLTLFDGTSFDLMLAQLFILLLSEIYFQLIVGSIGPLLGILWPVSAYCFWPISSHHYYDFRTGLTTGEKRD